MQSFDVIIAIKDSDWNIAKKAIPLIKKNIQPKKIVFISSERIKDDIAKEKDCVLLNEAEIFSGLSFLSVESELEKLNSNKENAGWYLQQFIKLSYAFICSDSYYLVWDADTLPLRHIDFFDSTGKPFFNLKREYVKSYFLTINNIFGYEKKTKESFISEHMLFNCEIVQKMCFDIMENKDLKGDSFWQKILFATSYYTYNNQRAFSEFETYGTYCDYNFKNYYLKRKLTTLRIGTEYLGANPTKAILEWAGKSFDIISFEHWGKAQPEALAFLENEEYRKTYSFIDLINKVNNDIRKKYFKAIITRDKDTKRNYHILKSRQSFDFFFDKKCNFGRTDFLPRKLIIKVYRKLAYFIKSALLKENKEIQLFTLFYFIDSDPRKSSSIAFNLLQNEKRDCIFYNKFTFFLGDKNETFFYKGMEYISIKNNLFFILKFILYSWRKRKETFIHSYSYFLSSIYPGRTDIFSITDDTNVKRKIINKAIKKSSLLRNMQNMNFSTYNLNTEISNLEKLYIEALVNRKIDYERIKK